MIIESVVALFMHIGGVLKENVPYDKTSLCLKNKRVIERSVSGNVTISCKKIKAKTEIDKISGKKRIIKIIE